MTTSSERTQFDKLSNSQSSKWREGRYMRYIDADKLQRHGNRGGVVYWRDIEEQPTADVRENVRGEWIEVEVFPEVYDIEGIKTWGSEMQCDQCGFRHTAIEGHMTQYNFCPNCGADMRQVAGKLKNSEDSTLSTC